MQTFSEILSTIHDYLGGHPWFLFFLLGTGVFFTIYLGFPQIRFFKHAIDIVRGKFDNAEDEGDTSHFQALATALSGTVGTGNIGGVAFAVHLGGPAALFWMIITAFLGMTTKFVEVTLSHKYREKAEDGTMAGGPMYYMKNKLGVKWLAIIFAAATVLSSFGTGNMPQINNIASSIETSFAIPPLVTGIVLAVLLGFVIIGGIKRIAAVTEKLVPTMSIIYLIGALSVIVYNFGDLGVAFGDLFSEIFTGTAARGGFIGASIAFAFNKGVGRGLFSNEAGQGSAPIAHASAKSNEPVSEGMVAILEPFIDTIIICTITGCALMASGVWSEKHQTDFTADNMYVLDKEYNEENEEDLALLSAHLIDDNKLPALQTENYIEYEEQKEGDVLGNLAIVNGKIISGVSIIHERSLAENITVHLIEEEEGNEDKRIQPFTGELLVVNGSVKIPEDKKIVFSGKSLVHSAKLTTIAFTRGFFGDWGQYIVSIGILLFAFSTAISWSYYGDRAMTFIAGSKSVIYYRIVYVAAFIFAAQADTSIVWAMADIAIVLMTVPNLVGILLLRKDMKETVDKYKEKMSL